MHTTIWRAEACLRSAANGACSMRGATHTKVVRLTQKAEPASRAHKGACRKPPEKVDKAIEIPLERCPDCGGGLANKGSCGQHTIELPTAKPLAIKPGTGRGHCARTTAARSRPATRCAPRRPRGRPEPTPGRSVPPCKTWETREGCPNVSSCCCRQPWHQVTHAPLGTACPPPGLPGAQRG